MGKGYTSNIEFCIMPEPDAGIDLYEEWDGAAWRPLVMNEFNGFLRGP